MTDKENKLWKIMQVVNKADFEGLNTLSQFIMGEGVSEKDFEEDDGEGASIKIEAFLKKASDSKLDKILLLLEDENLI